MLQPSVPLKPKNPEGPLRVLIIGRISTVHQKEESIEASYRYVEKYLKQVVEGPLEIKHLGERASGMLADRATIREAEDLIATGTWDLAVAEDLSRIFRNPRHQYNFVQDAVDYETRVICISDHLDTGDENWETMMSAATLRHGLTVPDTRRRVRRTATYAFHRGGMVQRVRYGYRKLSKEEAESGHFGSKGLAIAKRPECTPIIREMKERVLRGDTYTSIADWLNDEGIEVPPYATNGRWTDRLVRNLLRDPILSGQRAFRRTLYELIYRTGKHRRRRNPEPETESYPELAHLSPEEHSEILQAMERRARTHPRKSGRNHPLYGRPRSRSIWPAQHARCAICGGLFYRYNGHSLKCQNAHKRGDQRCWNHVQVDCETARDKILSWLVRFVDDCSEYRGALVDLVQAEPRRLYDRSRRAGQSLSREIEDLERQAANLAEAIAQGGRLEILLDRLSTVNEALAATRRTQAQRAAEASETGLLPTRESIEKDLESAIKSLARSSFELANLMRQVFTDFSIQPVQALDSGQVRPRAKLTVCLSPLGSLEAPDSSTSVKQITQIEVDLFDPPLHILHMPDCVKARKDNPQMSLRQIAASLGVNYMTVKRACDYSRRMEAEGLSEPFRELRQRPEVASRWARQL